MVIVGSVRGRYDLSFLFFIIKLVAWGFYYTGLIMGIKFKQVGWAIVCMLAGVTYQVWMAIRWEQRR